MTQVAELEQKWRNAAGLIDSADTPWESVKGLSDQAWNLGIELLRAPATGLGDVAIKVQWLAEQDLDSETSRDALRLVLTDLHRLDRH